MRHRHVKEKGGSGGSTFNAYFREIGGTELLSQHEEIELAKQAAEGNTSSRNQMICANLKLVVFIARRYAGKGLDIQDLIEEGNFGLFRAISKFDTTKGVRFSTYATCWIKQFMRAAIRDKAKTIRIPAYLLGLINEWRQAVIDLTEERGESPPNDDVFRRIGVRESQKEILLSALRIAEARREYGQNDEEDEFNFDSMSDHDGDPALLASQRDLQQKALEKMQDLDQREILILRSRFGIDDNNPKKLTEIARQLGITRERVRQIVVAALGKLEILMREK